MKTKATLYNSVTNILLYFLTIFVGIINRWAIIRFLGIEYQGINSLFSNILSMLSIAELGIGTAIVFHLYKPLEQKNTEEIKALMQFYRRCYYAIALAVFILGIIFIPFLDFFVNDPPGDCSVAFIYGWYLGDVVISYLFTFKRSILIADQKGYIITCCDIIYQITVKIGQAVILAFSGDFILYLVVMILCRAAENIGINVISNRRYPFLRDKKIIPISQTILNDIKRKVKGTFFHKIGSFMVLGTDNLIISRFLGLTEVGIYSNYFLIINSIQNICVKALTSATASVGHMLTEGDLKKNQRIYKQLLILNGLLVTVGISGVYSVASLFVSVIFGKEFIISSFTLFILTLNMYLQGTRTVYNMFKEAAGILYEDRWVPLVESFVNIAASVMLVKVFGLAGIFMGTILSTMIIFSYTYPVLVTQNILKITITHYWMGFFWMFGTAVLSIVISKALCIWMNENVFLTMSVWGIMIGDSILVLIVSSMIYILFFALWQEESKNLVVKLKAIQKNYFRRI